ncbi:cyclic nucleotide-binding domain protein (macronuclear) [Tetrahymena thermophila SB210]|uniref:Cyclic nucleotide-binding domain protein n=1 Tax=Tetrahymena thermophila (strain SB210) TaxID=312017 RepID=Q23K40_TETTS|nr:cyclic nucleotide-binding domain protein [Tetrahymena thermophila SB210]EAR97003.2 cyclic nucleotide-binding domain protein [Tetrahymena thermophila SB210]|eukprot:XP_001017248.2 cyclic nucleotide-binding domain protein [Tetrahymena thermophila SB210]
MQSSAISSFKILLQFLKNNFYYFVYDQKQNKQFFDKQHVYQLIYFLSFKNKKIFKLLLPITIKDIQTCSKQLQYLIFNTNCQLVQDFYKQTLFFINNQNYTLQLSKRTMNLSCGDSFYNSKIADNQSSRRAIEDASFQESSGRNKEINLIKKDDQFNISMNQFNNISDHNLKNIFKRSADNELISIQRSQMQSEKLPNLQKIIFNLKLKMIAQRLVNQTKSRMFLNLTNYQFKLINDLSWFKFPQNNKKQNSSKPKSQQEKHKFQNMKQRYSIVDLEEDKRPNKMFNFFKEVLKYIECFSSILNSIDQNLPVMHPNQLFKLIWDFISMIIILILLIQIPLYISFQQKLGDILNNTMINLAPIFIVVDTFISLNSGFYEKGLLISKRSTILIQYWKNHSLNELIILVSYIIHIFLRSDPQFSWSRYLLCSFAFKIKNLVILYNKSEEIFASRKYKQLLGLIRLILIIIITSHFISCFWILLSQIEEGQGLSQTWLTVRPIYSSEWIIQYMEAYYFAIVTMATVGFGDVLPITPIEKLFCVILMIISCGLFAYAMNTIGNILDNFNFEENELSKKMHVINLYMSKKNINKQMQYAIREYLDYYWREASERDQESEQKIISQLSDTLRENLVIEANKIVLKNSPVFRKYFSSGLKQSIVSLIKEYRCTPEELICSEGDIDDCSIFFIEKGSVEIFIETQSTNQQKPDYKSLVTLKQGQSFGELSFFTGMARSVSVRSKEFTTLLMIKRENFLELLQNFSTDLEQFCTIKDQLLLNNDYSCINLKCYSCQSQQHLLYQCPFLHLKVNKDKILFKHNKTEVQQRRNISRRLKKQNFFKQNELFNLEEIAEIVFQQNIDHQNIQEYLEQYMINYRHQSDSLSPVLNIQPQNQFHHHSENCDINSSQGQDDQLQQIQSNLYDQFISKKSHSLKVFEDFQNQQSQQNKSFILKDTQYQDEINQYDKSPLIFVKQKKNTFSKIESQTSPLSPKKKSQIKLVQTQDDQNSQDQNYDVSPHYPNYSSLQSVERISPLLKQKKISNMLNSFNQESKNMRQQSITQQNLNNCEKFKSFGYDYNLNSINQDNQQRNTQIKSPKYLICQISDLLGMLSQACENYQEETNDQIQKNQVKSLKAAFILSSNRQSQYLDLKNKVEKTDSLSEILNQDFFGKSLNNFDILKNFEIYFPFNNFSYQLKLMTLDKEAKKKIIIKNKIDNSCYFKTVNNSSRDIGQDFKARGSIFKNKQSSIGSVVQKFQKELEDEQYQNSIFIKKSKFFLNDQNDDSILSSLKQQDGYDESVNNQKLNKQNKKKNQTSLVNAISKTYQDEDDVSKEHSIINKSFSSNSLHKIQQMQPISTNNTKKNDSNIEAGLYQFNQDTRMQQIRTLNSNFSFDLQLNQKPNVYNLNESFNIQENSPANPINNINNNIILNQIKLKNDNELELYIDSNN